MVVCSGVSLMAARVCVTVEADEVDGGITFLLGAKDTSLVWQASGIRHAAAFTLWLLVMP